MRGTYFTTALRINDQAGNYTATIDDWLTDTITTMSSSSANNYIIPLNSSVNFPIGTQLLVAQEGLGQTTIVATSGVTINAVGLSISSRYKSVALIQVALNEWDAYGTLNFSYTARTTAFATATAITDTTILNALNTFDLGLISNGLASKMKAVYPFVGSTATTQKYNFMDARDLDIAFRLQFNGGWTHSSNGIQGNGTNTFADTFFKPSTGFSNHHNGGESVYSRTDISESKVDMGASDSAPGGNLNLTLRQTGIMYYQTGPPYASAAVTNSLGFYAGSSLTSTDRRIYQNGVKIGTNTTLNTEIANTKNIYIGALNHPSFFSTTRQYAFASLTEGMTDADQTNLYTLVQAFQTSLSRAV
jgi:hypothetical protein